MGEMVPIQQQALALRAAVETAKLDFFSTLGSMPAKNKERFFAMIMVACKNELVAKSTPQSVIECVLKSAALGLPINGTHSAIVPYRSNKLNAHVATFIPMYRGLVDLVRRSGLIRDVSAEVVMDGDRFTVSLGTGRRLTHVPKVGVSRVNPDNVVAAYCTWVWKDGRTGFETMDREELDRIWKRSRAQDGPWSTDRIAMYKKTVVRRACKLLPMPAEIAMALDESEREELGIEEPREVDFEEVADAGASLRAALQTKPAAAARQAPPEKAPEEPPAADGPAAAPYSVRGLEVDISEPFQKWQGRTLSVGTKANPKNDALLGKTCKDLLWSKDPAVQSQLAAVLAKGLEVQAESGMAPRDPFGYAAVLIEQRGVLAKAEPVGAPALFPSGTMHD